MAEGAVYREKLRHDVDTYNGPEHVTGAALLPLTGAAKGRADIPRAIAATAPDTARDLRDVKRDQSMTQRAWSILLAGGADAYEQAVAALRDDTRGSWQELLSECPDDGLTYAPTAEALRDWINHHWKEWLRELRRPDFRGRSV
jgi:hypothetical protein